ncbi:MAG: hypothetical protein LKE29_10605 [Acidaminococcaceae bacterium]|nr:hypothetical protein [Acidaminococcaceae bacterium]
MRDLEQGLEQMRRVPKQQVDMKLKPGSDSSHSIVVLDVKRQRMWGAGLSIDDSGLENTGRLQVSGNISLYNPTGMNDILSYSYSKDGEHQDSLHGTKDNSFFYSLPLGKYTFNASRYYNESYQQVPALVPFESRGKTTTWQAGLQRVLYRDSTRKTQGSFKIIKRRKRELYRWGGGKSTTVEHGSLPNRSYGKMLYWQGCHRCYGLLSERDALAEC